MLASVFRLHAVLQVILPQGSWKLSCAAFHLSQKSELGVTSQLSYQRSSYEVGKSRSTRPLLAIVSTGCIVAHMKHMKSVNYTIAALPHIMRLIQCDK